MLTKSAKMALWDCNGATYEITDAGLEISIDAKTQKALAGLHELEKNGEPVGFHTWEVLSEVIERCLCNGLTLVKPDEIGALTDSMILSESSADDDGKFPEDSAFYWFPDYQVKSPIEDLVQNGKVIFTTN